MPIPIRYLKLAPKLARSTIKKFNQYAKKIQITVKEGDGFKMFMKRVEQNPGKEPLTAEARFKELEKKSTPYTINFRHQQVTRENALNGLTPERPPLTHNDTKGPINLSQYGEVPERYSATTFEKEGKLPSKYDFSNPLFHK